MRHANLKVISKLRQILETQRSQVGMGCPWLGDVVESAIQTCPFLKQVACTHSEVSCHFNIQTAITSQLTHRAQSANHSSSVSVALRAAACDSIVPWGDVSHIPACILGIVVLFQSYSFREVSRFSIHVEY